jgi:hypothetical protein
MRFVPEIHSRKGSYLSLEELTKSRVVHLTLSSLNQPPRRIESLTINVHQGWGNTNFPGAHA